VDVLVVGGGITGVGCALDAITRGLSVAVVEQRDLASGTSSRSSKLIHGGLRYLEQFEFSLVKEALTERGLLLSQLAPHLVQPVDFLYPLTKFWERLYVGLGIGLYDLLAGWGGNPLPRHKHLSRKGVSSRAPALASHVCRGAIVYSDASVDDARYVISAARTAAGLGSLVLTSTKVTGIVHSNGRVSGAEVKCLETGQEFEVSCGTVVNATGVWSGDIEEYAGGNNSRVRASKGIHLLIPRNRLDLEAGLILRTSQSVLFVIPWDQHWIVGTTDTDWNLDRAHPAASRKDIDYLLSTLNQVLSTPLGSDDVVGVYAGLRPLLTGESEQTSKLSREHAVSISTPGLVSISGGKYTTYRLMASDTIDAVGIDQDLDLPASKTASVPLIGAAGYSKVRSEAEKLARDTGLGLNVIDHLISRHGDRIGEILELISARPDLADPLVSNHPYLRAEVVHAVRSEAALHLEDVLTRRTRLSVETWDRGTGPARQVAELMARELGWGAATIDNEVDHYLRRVESERESNTQLDDLTADAMRLGARDVRRGIS
tara:strand:+ start:449 stop:2083 length:1635 start_codon:yes stop_codon:yes gene_type:complete